MVEEMTRQENEVNEEVVWKLNPKALIVKNEQRSYNGGYLFLQKIYHELGLDFICKQMRSIIAQTKKRDKDNED